MKNKNLLSEMMKAIQNGNFLKKNLLNKVLFALTVFLFAIIINSCNKEKLELVDDNTAYEYCNEMDDYDYIDIDDEENYLKSSASIPKPSDNRAFWCAESGSIVDDKGSIYTQNGKYKANFRTASTPAPYWKREKNTVYQGNRSWKVVSQSGNNRSEVAILHPYKPDDGARWFAFAVYVDPSTTQSFFFCQFHQAQPSGGNNPPIFMVYTGSKWEFVVRTDNGRPNTKGQRQVLASGTMNKGRWYHFQMRLKPGLNGTADIKLWEKKSGDWQVQSLNWGSYPKNTVGYKYLQETSTLAVMDRWQFKVGIYGAANSTATIFMDNISYGKTKSDLRGL